jgi:hypothetical protein
MKAMIAAACHPGKTRRVEMTALPAPAPVWRRLHKHLWVGHTDAAPLGSIEQGRRYTYITPDGIAYGDYRSLDAAQAAATGTVPIVGPVRDGLESERAQQALLVASSTVALVVLGLVGTGMLLFV